ncbi:outer membrane protein [Novosphingobium kunmingense]|uniref:Outer membrane protein n=1 Tax=Novosphingobium kunmingense TaxID=1211806 RepID=A0A2N0H4Z3_9SPHN|nr:TolC family outer membrane protein [Novosphingobium kunmingense]PKB13993.1 outer membrane protein [Novosphingobium kunmingense]
MRASRLALLAGMAFVASPALADDLREALTMAYNGNPQLQAARAQQRAVDEGVPIARSASLPSVDGSATYTEFLHNSDSSPLAPDRNLSLGVDVGMPVYAGGAIKNSIRAARVRVAAGQADLRAAESGVFSQVVAAYMDVITAQAVVNLNRTNSRALGVNLQATRDRFEIGDLTRTDVAQSQSRLALAEGQARSAEAQLISARERYIQVVGKEPVDLQPPPPLPGLPASVDAAVATALVSNPDLIAAKERSRAAGFDTRVAGAGRLPTVSVFTGVDRSDSLGSNKLPGAVQSSSSAAIGVRASIPLFQGGLPAAQRRQAQAREGATLEQEIGIEREVIAATRSAFAQWQASQALITSSQSAVDAASLSLEGVRAENTVGNRTILDILNAEQELLNAQVQLVTARRNAYVAGFNLLSAMGKAEARDLGLDGGPLYDPQVNYDRVKNIIWDWQSDPAPKPQSTRTVDTKAQDGSVTK